MFTYADQLTYYRQPSLAQAYELRGHAQPLAERSHAKNTAFRIMGALNAVSGQVTYRQRSHTNLACSVDFWYDLRQAYPDAATIYVVVDNWPVLFHPEVLAPLQAQNLPWPPYVPSNWPKAAMNRPATTTYRFNCSVCRRMRRGSIPSRSCGAGSSRTCCISIGSVTIGPPSNRPSPTS